MNLTSVVTGRVTWAGETPAYGSVSTTFTHPRDWTNSSSADALWFLNTGLNLRSAATTALDPGGFRPAHGRRYFAMPSSGEGDSISNFDESSITYDHLGRAVAITDPTGTIDAVQHDVLGRVATVKRGLSLTTLRTLSTLEYDHGLSGRNGLLTKQTSIDNIAVPSTWRHVRYYYDASDRLRAMALPEGPHPATRMDNLGRVAASGVYAGSQASFIAQADSELDPSAVTTNRLSLTETHLDSLGRVFRSTTTTGTGTDAVQSISRAWYDERGRIALLHGGSSERFQYTDATWPAMTIVQQTCALAALPASYAEAMALQPGDRLLREVHRVYDSSGQFLDAIVQVDRHPERPGVPSPTGALTMPGFISETGSVDYTLAPAARTGVKRFARDQRGRTIKVVDFGNARYEPLASTQTSPAVVNESIAAFVPGSSLPQTMHGNRRFVVRAGFMHYDELGRVIGQYNERGDFACGVFDDADRPARSWSGLGGTSGLAGAILASESVRARMHQRTVFSKGRLHRVLDVDGSDTVLRTRYVADYIDTIGASSYPFSGESPRPLALDDRRARVRVQLPASTTANGSTASDDRWAAHNVFGELTRSKDLAGIVWQWTRDGRGRATRVDFDYAEASETLNSIPGVDDIIAYATFEVDAWGRTKGGEQFTNLEVAMSLGATSSDQCGCGCTNRVGNEARIFDALGSPTNPIGTGTLVPSPMSTHFDRSFPQSLPGHETNWSGGRLEGITLPPGGSTDPPTVTMHFSGSNGLDQQLGRTSGMTSPLVSDRALATYGHWGIGPSRRDPITMNPDGRTADPLGRDHTHEPSSIEDFAGSGEQALHMIYRPPFDSTESSSMAPAPLVWNMMVRDPLAQATLPDFLTSPPGMITPMIVKPQVDLNATGYGRDTYHPWDDCACTMTTPRTESPGVNPFGVPEEDRWAWCAGLDCDSGAIEADPPAADTRYADPDPRTICNCEITTTDNTNPTETKRSEPAIYGLNAVSYGPDAATVGNSVGSLDIRLRERWSHPSNAAQSLDERGNWRFYLREGKVPGPSDFFSIYQSQTTFNDADQATSIVQSGLNQPTSASPRYDRRGNLRDDGHRIYQYDVFNRLTRVYYRTPTGNASGEYARFHYDVFGHRVSARYDKNNNGSPADDPADLYAYDDRWRVVAVARHEPAVGQTPARSWVREQWIYHQAGDGPGASGDDTPIARRLDENADGVFDSTQFFLADRQGSVMAIVSAVHDTSVPPDGVPDRPGAIIAKVRYSAYGEPAYRHPLDFDGDGVVGGPVEIAEDYQALLGVLASYGSYNNPYRSGWGNLANASGQRLPGNVVDPATEIQYFQQNYPAFERNLQEEFGNLPLYAGYWWDPQLKLYHVRHRAYDPFRGRWLQRDPIGYAGGPNLYQYVGGLPYAAVDPMGLYSMSEWGQILGAGMQGAWEGARNELRGAGNMAKQMAANVIDTGGLILETVTDGGYTHDALGEQAQRALEGTHDVAQDTLVIGGRAALAIGSAGASEVVIGAVELAQTGDYDAFSQQMGAVGVANLFASRLAQARNTSGTTSQSASDAATSTPRITGYTKHGLDQAISRDGHGVSPQAILDAVRNPLETASNTTKGTVRYVGRNATVILNARGKVVTTWPRNLQGYRCNGE